MSKAKKRGGWCLLGEDLPEEGESVLVSYNGLIYYGVREICECGDYLDCQEQVLGEVICSIDLSNLSKKYASAVSWCYFDD